VAACGGDDDGAADTTAAAGTGAGDGVTVEGFAFTPASLTVPAGTTVVWTNKDGAEHTVVGTELSGQLAPGGTYEKRFDTAGTYTYACTIHPTMTGSITVT
jgi:plastocyanin